MHLDDTSEAVAIEYGLDERVPICTLKSESLTRLFLPHPQKKAVQIQNKVAHSVHMGAEAQLPLAIAQPPSNGRFGLVVWWFRRGFSCTSTRTKVQIPNLQSKPPMSLGG